MATRSPLVALTLLLAATPVAVSAQAHRVTGRVLDATTGAPVAGAELALGDVARAITDSAGRFELAPVPSGRLPLRIRHVAYGTQLDTLEVARDVALEVRISPQAIELAPLRVEADVRESTQTSRSYVITRAQIEAVLGRARHLGDVVRTYIPGATVYEARAGYVCLEFRGARGARTRGCNAPMVIVDDVPIPGAAQFLRDTPPEDIERIEFVPASAGAARYGMDSQYGALVIRTRRSGIGRAAAPPVRTPAGPPAYPAYSWEREQSRHPWPRTIAASAVGNALGVATGLAALGCFDSGAEGDCLTRTSVGAGLATLALPVLGATAGANLFGGTDLSHGRPLPAAVAAAIPILIGYAMARDGTSAGFGTSRAIGGALVFIGAPFAATIADGLFRRPRAPDPPR